MSDSYNVTVVKLGGSLVTNKDKALSINSRALRSVARQIGKCKLPNRKQKLILIHGGGSFGHYYAKKFGLSAEPKKVPASAISKTTAAMFDLHSRVRKFLARYGVNTETILPSELLDEKKTGLSELGRRRISDSFSNGLIPISFGHVEVGESSASIISGDVICEAITGSFKVNREIFAMDVDGIYPTANLRGKIIERLEDESEFSSKKRRFDVTGGVEGKVSLGFRLARRGVKVYFVSGVKDERLLKLMIGEKDVAATRIDPR